MLAVSEPKTLCWLKIIQLSNSSIITSNVVLAQHCRVCCWVSQLYLSSITCFGSNAFQEHGGERKKNYISWKNLLHINWIGCTTYTKGFGHSTEVLLIVNVDQVVRKVPGTLGNNDQCVRKIKWMDIKSAAKLRIGVTYLFYVTSFSFLFDCVCKTSKNAVNFFSKFIGKT